MAKLRAIRINQVFLLFVVCVGSATLGFALRDNKTITAKANKSLLQQKDEKVIKRYDHGGEPVEFNNLRLKNIKFAPDKKFSARSIADTTGGSVENWLEDLTFTLKNKSDKQITYILLELQFPETGLSGPRMVYNKLGIGIHPKASGDELLYGEPLLLNPGDKITFRLSANALQSIKDFLALRKIQLADLSEAASRLVYVIFDDGVKWELRNYFRPNPNVPGGYELIKQ